MVEVAALTLLSSTQSKPTKPNPNFPYPTLPYVTCPALSFPILSILPCSALSARGSGHSQQLQLPPVHFTYSTYGI